MKRRERVKNYLCLLEPILFINEYASVTISRFEAKRRQSPKNMFSQRTERGKKIVSGMRIWSHNVPV